MKKIQGILLPLALVFGAIAVFETGARYGTTNMRALAIAKELQLPLGIYLSGHTTMDDKTHAQLVTVIDNGIAAGAIHRQSWYLNKESKAQLEKVLRFALSMRGDAAAKRFEAIANSEPLPEGVNLGKLDEIRRAIDTAQVELIDNAPSLNEAQQVEQANDIKIDS